MEKMNPQSLIFSALMVAIASTRSMTPMASIVLARLLGRQTPGKLMLLNKPVFAWGAVAMGIDELLGDKMKSAPDHTAALGLRARVCSAAIAGAALAPHGRAKAGALTAVSVAVALSYLTLAGRKHSMARIGQTRSGLIEDAVAVTAADIVVALAVEPNESQRTRP